MWERMSELLTEKLNAMAVNERVRAKGDLEHKLEKQKEDMYQLIINQLNQRLHAAVPLQTTNPVSKAVYGTENADSASTVKDTTKAKTDDHASPYLAAQVKEPDNSRNGECDTQSRVSILMLYRAFTDPNYVLKHHDDEYVEQFLENDQARRTRIKPPTIFVVKYM